MCNHKQFYILETIEATTSHVVENGRIYHNNEYGNIIRIEVICYSCKKKWNIIKNYEKLPKKLWTPVIEFRNLYEVKQLKDGEKIY